jgi:hypothetical protein
MTSNTLCPPALRQNPQVACLDLLAHATEVAVIALCAAHPAVEHELDDDVVPGDRFADRIIERALALLDAVDCYRLLLHDPKAFDDTGQRLPF